MYPGPWLPIGCTGIVHCDGVFDPSHIMVSCAIAVNDLCVYTSGFQFQWRQRRGGRGGATAPPLFEFCDVTHELYADEQGTIY